MVFETKKINIETLGEYLQEVRLSLNLSLPDAAKKSGIKEKHLESLESGRFSALPAEVYVLGFLKSLAVLYSTEPGLLIKQYKKERNIQTEIQKKIKQKNGMSKKIFFKFLLTPKIFSLILGVGFVLLTGIYIIWQVISINKTPELRIYEPQDASVITDAFVNVRGKTNPGMSVSVNGQDIFVESSGDFQTQLGVSSGSKELKIVAKNKLDKSVEKNIRIVVKSPEEGQIQNNSFTIKLELLGDAQVGFALDEGESQSLTFHNGDTKLLTAQKKIIISTTNAGVTRISLDGKDMGLMGRPGEVLVDIPFFAESDNINASSTKP